MIVRTEKAKFPAYEDYKGMKRYAPTPEAYERAMNDGRFTMERLTYRSDDLEVHAYLYRPVDPPATTMPVVIFNRGSHVREEFVPEVLMPGNRLAQEGYLVIAPMLRGSGGAPGHDEMGGADLRDLFNIEAVLRESPYADPRRMFLYGESRGGIMSLLAVKQGFPARAIATFGAITDFGDYLLEGGSREGLGYRKLGESIWKGFPANEAEIIETRSAQRWPEKIGVPVLLMNGGEDEGCPPTQAIELALLLEQHDKPYELKIFHGEGHVLGGRAAERDADVVRWFRSWEGAKVPAR